LPKLSDSPAVLIVNACHTVGGNKSRPYLFGETAFAVAGFIPASKGQKVS
jgi:hypothetical protein